MDSETAPPYARRAWLFRSCYSSMSSLKVDGYEVRIVGGHAELPEGIRSIGAKAFYYCDGQSGRARLRTITVGSNSFNVIPGHASMSQSPHSGRM